MWFIKTFGNLFVRNTIIAIYYIFNCYHTKALIPKKIGALNKSILQQESPPAWTQEAYHPPCSKYFLCCPNWVPPWQGTPLAGYPPRQGTPRAGYLPGWTWQGTPPSWTWQGTPPDCPMAFWEMLQIIMGYGYPPRCGQTNKVKLLPSRRTTYAGGKKTFVVQLKNTWRAY